MSSPTLRDAISNGDLPGFESLISGGADLDDGGAPPLLELAASAGHGAIARRLLELGASIERAPRALAHAARHGDALLVEQLLARGARTDVPDDDAAVAPLDGRPLARAAQRGSLECVELLLPHVKVGLDEALAGAAIAVAPGHGIPAGEAVSDELRERVLAIVAKLIERGASAEGLARAAVTHTDEPWLVERALDAGVAPALADESGATLVHLAARRHAHKLITALLARGATPAPRDAAGQTPLEAAQKADSTDITMKRMTLTVLRRAAGSFAPRSRTREVPPVPGTLRAGARVTHPDHGEGTVMGIKDGMARVRFSATKTEEIAVDEITSIR